jgi:hypothetical protein
MSPTLADAFVVTRIQQVATRPVLPCFNYRQQVSSDGDLLAQTAPRHANLHYPEIPAKLAGLMAADGHACPCETSA